MKMFLVAESWIHVGDDSDFDFYQQLSFQKGLVSRSDGDTFGLESIKDGFTTEVAGKKGRYR
jgi:hypothetical protein